MTGSRERTRLVKTNIIGSFLVKGWSVVVQLLLVPVTLRCLNQYEYGIWLTIQSVLIWMDQMDIGLGNGLRNRLAESLALGEKQRARRQVSTTFIMLLAVMLPIVGVGCAVIAATDTHALLNIDAALVPHLDGLLIAALATTGFTFVMKGIGNVYLGMQKTAVNNALIVSGQTLALGIIFLLSLFDDHSLLHVALAYTLSPLLIYLLAWPITFTRHAYLRPSWRLFDRQELRGLLSLGVRFFLVQVAGVVLFFTSSLLLSRLFSPAEVAPYQIAYRYYSLMIVLFSIIVAPLWAAITDARTTGDWQWIRRTTHKIELLLLVSVAALVVMTLIAPWIYRQWINDKVAIPAQMSVWMAVYTFVIVYSTSFSHFIFGLGKLRLITWVSIAEAIVYIPLAVIMGRWLGPVGIVIALIIANLPCAITNRIQFSMLTGGTAKGIWNR